MNGYSVKIKESSRELSPKEKIKYKDTSDCHKLDDIITEGNPLAIEPIGYVVLAVHNEKSDNTDYEQFLIFTADNSKYVTGSQAFWDSFKDIWDEMGGIEGDEPWMINIYKKPSNNFKGKFFLTCSII